MAHALLKGKADKQGRPIGHKLLVGDAIHDGDSWSDTRTD